MVRIDSNTPTCIGARHLAAEIGMMRGVACTIALTAPFGGVCLHIHRQQAALCRGMDRAQCMAAAACRTVMACRVWQM